MRKIMKSMKTVVETVMFRVTNKMKSVVEEFVIRKNRNVLGEIMKDYIASNDIQVINLDDLDDFDSPCEYVVQKCTTSFQSPIFFLCQIFRVNKNFNQVIIH